MSQDDSKVIGHNEESSGETYGVWGEADSTDGYGLGTPDDARIDGVVDGGAEWTVEVQDGTAGNVVQGDPSNSADAGSDGQTVSGGDGNATSADYATIGGGHDNTVSEWRATVAGGEGNQASGPRATIAGGSNNVAGALYATVGGGQENEASATQATVGGGEGNLATAQNATIAGGGRATFQNDSANHVYDQFGTIGGGGNNRAGLEVGGAEYATVSGGMHNDATGESASIGGGWNNAASGTESTVGGGFENEATASRASVAGGYDNTATGVGSSVGGGQANDASGGYATAAGGVSNVASGDYASVFGGRENIASGDYSAAGGRTASANHAGSFVWGGSNSSTFSSTGTDQFLVDGDVGIGTDDPANQFHVAGRSAFDSRVGVGTDSPARSLHVKPTGTSHLGLVLQSPNDSWGWGIGVTEDQGGELDFFHNSNVSNETYYIQSFISTDGAYNEISDERLKRDIEELDGILDDVLSLRPTTYQFENSSETESRSYGFIAQDVQPLFPDIVQEHEREGHLCLSYANFSVLAIQAIQEQQDLIDAQDDALEELISEMDSLQQEVSKKHDRLERLERENEHKDERIEELAAENNALSQRVSAVEDRLSALTDSGEPVSADD